ncbi:MAG: menaquinone biosynthetic enzyme MqnA/MqnD family protein [Candidatus Zixiibacteriota bacterium]
MDIRYIGAGPGADPSVRRGWAGIKFLNAYPLVRGLADDLPGWSREIGTPAECASFLDSGAVDIALVPLVTAVTNGWPFLGDVGIACRGPVSSVKLIYNSNLKFIRSYRPDPASGTSNVLARLLYNLEYGRDITPDLKSEDAEIVIGDRAFEAETADQLDLGQAWFEETGLPFVFGVWAGRDEAILKALSEVLVNRLRANLDEPEPLIHEASRLTGKLINVQEYLYDRLHYALGEHDFLGMKTFVDLAYKYGLIPTDRMRMCLTQPTSAVES